MLQFMLTCAITMTSYIPQGSLQVPHFELQGKTIGLIGGRGNIGSATAKLCIALGMRVIVSSRSDAPSKIDGVVRTISGFLLCFVFFWGGVGNSRTLLGCFVHAIVVWETEPPHQSPLEAALRDAVYADVRTLDGAIPTISKGITSSVEDLLKVSDFVSLHCPLTASTKHLINAATLKIMKPTAYLINTARGAIVDEYVPS